MPLTDVGRLDVRVEITYASHRSFGIGRFGDRPMSMQIVVLEGEKMPMPEFYRRRYGIDLELVSCLRSSPFYYRVSPARVQVPTLASRQSQHAGSEGQEARAVPDRAASSHGGSTCPAGEDEQGSVEQAAEGEIIISLVVQSVGLCWACLNADMPFSTTPSRRTSVSRRSCDTRTRWASSIPRMRCSEPSASRSLRTRTRLVAVA